ncbi:MAG TPA: hypothetical protein VMD92_03755 [Acidobacteriaceae bacterium]|nr:hypothetical protein [Acidobacteriaceae bacterium]
MRTTVEMKPEHRSALLSLASRRGQKGFSAVLEEAIEHYLRAEQDREKRRKVLLSLGGSLSPKEADRMRRTARDLREHWR